MLDKSWSSTTISKKSFPEVTGQPKYLDDHCTFILPVKLVAGKTYAILLNSERFKNFKDADGHSAMPYLLVFKTKGDLPAVAAKTKPDGYGYFLMTNQSAVSDENVQQAIAAIQKLHAMPGFVVDLRQANGGDELLARQIAVVLRARHGVRKKQVSQRSKPCRFTDALPRSLSGVKDAFTKPVVCLIGPGAVSSGEGLVPMMKCLPQVTTVGLPTRAPAAIHGRTSFLAPTSQFGFRGGSI